MFQDIASGSGQLFGSGMGFFPPDPLLILLLGLGIAIQVLAFPSLVNRLGLVLIITRGAARHAGQN
jgi:hypothetical protein